MREALALTAARLVFALAATAGAAGAAGCKAQPTKVPGETSVRVAEVEITAWDRGAKLALGHGALFERLGMRPGSAIATERRYSPFREAEDRRRVEAFWQQFGYFDAQVSPAEVRLDADTGKVTVRFRVRENARYRVGEVHVTGAPPEAEATLPALVPFDRGATDVDLEAFRAVRLRMADLLRRAGRGHANVHSRFYVDRKTKTITVYYFADPGPKTFIANLAVQGNARVPADAVLRRAGLAVGQPYGEDLRDQVTRDLLDTGAFASVFLRADTDTTFIPPGTAPDSGGEVRDAEVDAQGNLVPRALEPGVRVTVHVVEAPRAALKLRAAAEIDPARADATVASTVWLRDALGTYRHVVLDGRAGYGALLGDASRLDLEAVRTAGPYGDATARLVFAGAAGRLGDLRLTGRYRGELFPGAFLTRIEAGPGARTTLDAGLYFDIDALATWSRADDYGPFTAAERDRLALPSRATQAGAELDASLVWDRRDDPVEPMRGHFAGLFARFAPGGALGTHRFANLAPDARGFVPLGRAVSLGLRASGEFSFLADDAGTPLTARVFGGGAYGFRGRGRQRLSPTVSRCDADECAELAVGGRSLVEASAELRFLPPRKQYGAVAFADLGGASGGLDPFALGPSFAAGLGLRLRLWYVPLALDVAWRVLGEGELQSLPDSPLHAFLRIGEAF